MSYVDEIYAKVVEQNPGEAEFHQAVKEVLDSLRLVIDANEEKYRSVSLLERLVEPERIICYNTPFPEMQGDIVYVDYERSSWRYMDYDQKAMPHEDLDCYKIGGANHTFCDTMDAYMIGKGGGSAYGGKWRPNPNKPQDQRYLGNPGEIKRTIMNNGDVYKTKMGPDGRAEMERHETNHNRGDKHTNPHDHRIS